jgi:histone H3/H4
MARPKQLNPKKLKTDKSKKLADSASPSKKKTEFKPPAPVEPAGKKRRRDKFGRKQLRAIKHQQQSVEEIFPYAVMKRLVKEVASNVRDKPYRFEPEAIKALQIASEDFLVQGFRDGQHLQCNIATNHTLRVPAFKAALQLKPGNTVALPTPSVKVKVTVAEDSKPAEKTVTVADGTTSD